MNWFERNGIPGMYFFGLTLTWLYIIFPCGFNTINWQLIAAGAVIAIIPIGYILTTLQTMLYYKCKCLRVHFVAKYKFWKIPRKENEETLEAESLLTTIESERNSEGKLNLKGYKFASEWVRKRVDYVVISSSIILATFISIIVAIVIFILSSNIPDFFFGLEPQLIWSRAIMIFLISVSIALLMWRIRRKYNRQVVLIWNHLFYEGDNPLKS